MAEGGTTSAGTAPASSDRTGLRGVGLRWLLAAELIAMLVLGLWPYLAPAEFARTFGLAGDEPYLYRLAGAAVFGYATAALAGLVRGGRPGLRIPLAALLTFGLSAVAGALASVDESGVQPLPVVLVAGGALFAAGAAMQLWRGGTLPGNVGDRLEPGLRLTLAGATVAATLFAGWQLLLPRGFASFFGLSAADLVIIRLAGAATLGYALAGLLATAVDRWPAARIQTFPSISANILAAIASAIYIAGGGRSILGPLFLLASGLLVLSLTAWAARAER
jgi:hypothetical protein